MISAFIFVYVMGFFLMAMLIFQIRENVKLIGWIPMSLFWPMVTIAAILYTVGKSIYMRFVVIRTKRRNSNAETFI